MHTRICAFDVLGTLIDTTALSTLLEPFCGDNASHINHRWRQRQIEYLMRRAAMQRYCDFDTLTADALSHTLAEARIFITKHDHAHICASIRQLVCHPDTHTTLKRLRAHGWRCVLFSNATPATLDALVTHNHLTDYLDGVISVAPFKCFKPHPDAYRGLTTTCGARRDRVWLASGNHWDVTGAVNAGLHGAWIVAPEMPDGRWEDVPVDVRVPSLTTLADYLTTQVVHTSDDD